MRSKIVFFFIIFNLSEKLMIGACSPGSYATLVRFATQNKSLESSSRPHSKDEYQKIVSLYCCGILQQFKKNKTAQENVYLKPPIWFTYENNSLYIQVKTSDNHDASVYTYKRPTPQEIRHIIKAAAQIRNLHSFSPRTLHHFCAHHEILNPFLSTRESELLAFHLNKQIQSNLPHFCKKRAALRLYTNKISCQIVKSLNCKQLLKKTTAQQRLNELESVERLIQKLHGYELQIPYCIPKKMINHYESYTQIKAFTFCLQKNPHLAAITQINPDLIQIIRNYHVPKKESSTFF